MASIHAVPVALGRLKENPVVPPAAALAGEPKLKEANTLSFLASTAGGAAAAEAASVA